MNELFDVLQDQKTVIGCISNGNYNVVVKENIMDKHDQIICYSKGKEAIITIKVKEKLDFLLTLSQREKTLDLLPSLLCPREK